jgi:N-acetylglutamate synthase-like GNAT family acetyltransferase
MVHPDFQNGGLGSVLTKYCNTISDKAGRRTFVALRPASVKMFNRLGFKIVGKHDSHLERWGGSRDGSLTFMAVREAELL